MKADRVEGLHSGAVTELDEAWATLEGLAVFAGLDRESVEAWLLRDTHPMRRVGVQTLVPRWIERPLGALRAFAAARTRAAHALEATLERLACLEARLAGLRDAGNAEFVARQREAAGLLCLEADLRERLGRPEAELLEQARRGIASILEVSLPVLARATVRFAEAALQGPARRARSALYHVARCQALAARAAALIGPVEIPMPSADQLVTLRRRLGTCRNPLRPLPAAPAAGVSLSPSMR